MQQGSEEEDLSFYAVLNVSKSASQEDIRKAYRKLASVVHPDKHTNDELAQAAKTCFTRLTEAYEVLSNPEKRKIYDVYGRLGLKAGLQVSTHVDGMQNIRLQWEKFRAEQERARYEREINHRGNYQVKLDASGMFDGQNHPHPDVITIANSTNVHVSLHEKSLATLGGQVSMRRRGNMFVGVGQVHAGLHQILSDEDTVEVSGAVGLQSAFGCNVIRQLTEHDQVVAGMSYQPGRGLSLQITSNRQLADHTNASASMALAGGKVAGMGVNISHSHLFQGGDSLTLAAHADVGAEPSRIKLGFKKTGVYRFHKGGIIKGVAKLGLAGTEVEVGVGKKISDYNSGYFAVVWGLAGIHMKLKYIRGGQSFEFPFILSHNYDEWRMLILAYTVPPIFSYTIARFVVIPAQKLYKKYYQPKLSQQQQEEIDQAFQENQQAIMVLKPAVYRKIREELTDNGIIVIDAAYGCLDTYFDQLQNGVIPHPQENGGDQIPSSSQQASNQHEWLDVTVAVQFLVNGGQLELFEGSSKQHLIGFNDPCPTNKKKQLHIRWLQHGSEAYQITVEDKGGCRIPGNGQVVKENSQLFKIMMAKFDDLRRELNAL